MAARGIEKDEGKHKAKWELYQTKKDALVADEWSVTCKPSRKQKIDIGEKVVKKAGNKRVGVVVGSPEN